MVTCDLFELSIEAKGEPGVAALIVWSLYTDLPAGTRVILSCQRSFLNLRDEHCLWVGYGEAVEIMPSIHGDYGGASGRVDVNASDQKALKLFSEINSPFSAGIKTRVSDEIELLFTVGARQRLRAFGRMNANLSGQMVQASGGVNVVAVSKKILLPMREELQPVEKDA